MTKNISKDKYSLPLTSDIKEDPILTFLALFNQIDKHFDKVLGIDNFLPYNEKIKRILKENTPISWFVKIHQYQLRYFGEVRNQITHGIKLDGHTYVTPTPYALEKLTDYAHAIKSPPTCGEVFRKEVFSSNTEELLGDLVNKLKEHKYTHIPVYTKDHRFVGLIILEYLFIWIVEKFEHKKEWESLRLKDIPMYKDNAHVTFVHEGKSIYEIDQLFTTRKLANHSTGIVLVTTHGKANEQLIGIITPSDSAIVDNFVMH